MAHVSWHDVVLLDKNVQYSWRYECRKDWSKMYVLYSKVKHCQQNSDCLLLKPRYGVRNGQRIDVRFERVCEGLGDDDCTVRVVALSDIQEARQSGGTERSKFVAVETVFGAAHGEYESFRWQSVCQISEITALVLRSITSTNDKHTFQFSVCHCLQYLNISQQKMLQDYQEKN